MNKTVKYFIVIFLNAIVLIGLSKIWIDSFALKINPNVQSNEIFKIIGLSILSLIGIRLLVIFFRKRNIQCVKRKIKLAALLILLICSYAYIGYSMKIVNNRLLNNEIREGLINRVNKSVHPTGLYTIEEKLTFNEYEQISKIKGFNKLPYNATDIDFEYHTYGFLFGDYSYKVTFDLPLGSDIKEISFRDGDFQITQRIVELKDKLKVTYEESQS